MKCYQETSNLLSQKYVISPIDGNTYCRANGKFLRHLKQNGYDDYKDFYVSYYPGFVQYCLCGEIRSFNTTKMLFGQTCGNRDCCGKIHSANLKDKTPEYWDKKRETLRKTLKINAEDIKIKIQEKRDRCIQNGTYMKAVIKRRETCTEKYNDPTYSNPSKASKTKLNWSPERKQQFLERVRDSLGGKWMNDFTTDETWIQRSIKLWNQGRCVHPNDRTDWYRYKRKVWNLTTRNYRKYKHIINPNDYIRTTGGDGYHLDHIMPIHYGFVNGILPSILAEVKNLQMLPWRENIAKGNKYAA